MLIRSNAKKQIKMRKQYFKHFHKIQAIKAILRNNKLSNDFKLLVQQYLLTKFNKINLSSLNRYCLETSNFRSVYQRFQLSRRALKRYSSIGRIPGLFKK